MSRFIVRKKVDIRDTVVSKVLMLLLCSYKSITNEEFRDTYKISWAPVAISKLRKRGYIIEYIHSGYFQGYFMRIENRIAGYQRLQVEILTEGVYDIPESVEIYQTEINRLKNQLTMNERNNITALRECLLRGGWKKVSESWFNLRIPNTGIYISIRFNESWLRLSTQIPIIDNSDEFQKNKHTTISKRYPIYSLPYCINTFITDEVYKELKQSIEIIILNNFLIRKR